MNYKQRFNEDKALLLLHRLSEVLVQIKRLHARVVSIITSESTAENKAFETLADAYAWRP